ncbi:MAG TPA: CBS domain-containing protein [Jatrophihabitans sp.]|nr:CBS domain-containing protein [Jatrophihabitans sp.]
MTREVHAPASKVADVMTKQVVAAHADASFKHIVEFLARNQISCVPVITPDHRVAGMVSESDLLAHLVETAPWYRRRPWPFRGREHLGVTAAELMTAPAITVRPTDSIATAATRALQAHVHRMPVVDYAGVLIGIVSRADLLRCYLRPDEQIRDEITTRIIRQDLAMDPARFTVSVQDGLVRIDGELEWPGVGDQLVDSIRELPGVVSVEHHLTTQAAG